MDTISSSAGSRACSVEVADDLSSNLPLLGVLVSHDALVGGDNHEAELAGGEDRVHEVLELGGGEIETGGDDTALVEAAVQLDDDLATAGVVDDGEFVDVTLLLHEAEELDEDLGDRSEDNLHKSEYSELGWTVGACSCSGVIERGHLRCCEREWLNLRRVGRRHWQRVR